MPLCGFNPKMIQGIAIFAEGLFEATVARANEGGQSLPEAFKTELDDITRFLEALEDRHQALKREGASPDDIAKGAAEFAFHGSALGQSSRKA